MPPRVGPRPSRWVAVIGAGDGKGDGNAQGALGATIADPAGAPALTIDADGSDRDADGIDDVALRVTLEERPAARAGSARQRGPRLARSASRG